MAIYRLLQNSAFDPDHVSAMTAAFDVICSELNLSERNDPLRDIIAKEIIDCAQRGQRHQSEIEDCVRRWLKDKS